MPSTDELMEMRFSLKNELESPAFSGNPLALFVDELQMTLAPVVVKVCSDAPPVSNAIPADLAYMEELPRGEARTEKFPLSLQNPKDGQVIACTISARGLLGRGSEVMSHHHPFRTRFPKVRSMISIGFDYNRAPPPHAVTLVECYFDLPTDQDKFWEDGELFSITDLCRWVARCIDDVNVFRRDERERRQALAMLSPIPQKSIASILQPILAETKILVERLLPEVDPAFEAVARNRMLLQFFVIDKTQLGATRLRYLPTPDQVERFRASSQEILSELADAHFELGAGGQDAPLKYVREYLWDANRSFSGYVCETGCYVYSNDWRAEPLVIGEHLSQDDRLHRGAASLIMQAAQGRGESSRSVLLMLPWFIGQVPLGALQINATSELSQSTIRAAVKLIKGVFNISGLELRHADILGDSRAISQLRTALVMLGHDAPKFVSTPLLASIRGLTHDIQDYWNHLSDKASADALLVRVDSEMPLLRALVDHYDAFMRGVLGSSALRGPGELMLSGDFRIEDCRNSVDNLLRVLLRLATSANVELRSQLANAKLTFEASRLARATIVGSKLLLVEVIFNLVSNSLDALIRYAASDLERLDTNRLYIQVEVEPETVGERSFLRVTVRDFGVGMTSAASAALLQKVELAERKRLEDDEAIPVLSLLGDVPGDRGRGGYGVSVILSVLLLLAKQFGYKRPVWETEEDRGTTWRVWFPIEKVRIPVQPEKEE